MARGRFISKAISLDEKVDSLSSDTVRLLFTWLITHLDCEGRMYGDAQTVKSIVFPRRSMKAQTIEKYLSELEQKGLILRYSAPTGTYLCMQNFEKHQPGLNKDRESQSQIPPITPELLQSKVGKGLTQVKVEVKDKEETKEESSLVNVFETYKKEIMGCPDESFSIPEDIENELKLTVERFTAPWVVDAILEGVKRKRKDWGYIVGILKNWKKYGKDAKMVKTKNSYSQDPNKYIRGKYGHLTQR